MIIRRGHRVSGSRTARGQGGDGGRIALLGLGTGFQPGLGVSLYSIGSDYPYSLRETMKGLIDNRLQIRDLIICQRFEFFLTALF